MKTNIPLFGILTLTCGLAVCGYSQSFLTNGLVAYYPFNGNANDAVGANNGNVNGATLTTDRFGERNAAYHFGGSNSITASDNGLPLGNAPRTISLWVNCHGVSTPKAYAIPFAYGTYTTSQGNWINIFTGNDGTGRPVGSVLFDFYNSSLLSTNLIQVWTWQHLVCSLDSSSTARIYIGGQLAGVGSVSANTTSSGTMLIGDYGGTDPANNGVNGEVDDVRIYNRALSASEVQQLYVYESQTHWGGPFQLVAGGFSWSEAKADAVSRGGHLATFGTQAKWNSLVNEFGSNSGIVVDAWIGGKLASGNWTWITGEPWAFSTWYPGDPKGSQQYDSLIVCFGGFANWNLAKWNDTSGDNGDILGYGKFSYILELGPRVDLIKAVKPSFTYLTVGTNYQLQVSADMKTWTNQGAAFTATNTSMIYPQYWDVDNWNSLFFRLQVVP